MTPLFENQRSEMILMRIAEARMPELYKRRVEQTNLLDLDPDKLTPAMLDKIAPHLIQKALGPNATPEVIAETKRRLEAGETVDAVCEDVTDKEPRK